MAVATSSWFIRSRLTAELRSTSGRIIVTHLLARSRVVLTQNAYEFLHSFDRPREVEGLWASVNAPGVNMHVEGRWFHALRSALLLRPTGNQEAERIRRAYATQLQHRDTFPLGVLSDSLSFDHSNLAWRNIDCEITVSAKSLLKLSECLAKLDLAHGGVLVTHALGSPVELDAALWRLATRFDGTKTVEEISDESGQDLEVISSAARFLLLKRLAFDDPSTELKLADHAAAAEDVLNECRSIHPPENRWRQRYRPYTLDKITQVKGLLRVALIGPCQMQLHAEALESTGYDARLCLSVTSFLQPSAELKNNCWAAVVCSAASFMARFLEATWISPSQVRHCIPEMLARIDNWIYETRQYTDAAILLLGFSRLSFTNDRWWTSINVAIAEANQKLASYMSDRKDVVVVDQDEIAATFIGEYWDDRYTASPHHSPISSWSWVTLKPNVTDQAIDSDPFLSAPPITSGQADPACALAERIVRFILEQHALPIKLALIDPDDLLWPGTLIPRPPPLGSIPHYFADVEQYLYSGIHEAISIIKERGIGLALATDKRREQLEEVWHTKSPVRNIVRLTDFTSIVPICDLEAIRNTLTQLKITPQETLWLSRSRQKPLPNMHAYSGDVWKMRSFLLNNPLMTSRFQAPPHQAKPSEAIGSASARPTTDNVRESLFELIALSVGSTARAVTATTDLRLLGLDSIGIVDLLNRIEQDFGIQFEDADFTESIAFNRDALLRSVVRASHRVRLEPNESDDCLGQQVERANTLGELVRFALAASKQDWVFKILRSSDIGDCDYLSPRVLLHRAERHALWLRSEGLEAGSVLAIQTENPPWQIDLLFASLIAGILPVVTSAPTSLDDSGISEWASSFLSLAPNAAVFTDNKRLMDGLTSLKQKLKLLGPDAIFISSKRTSREVRLVDPDEPALALRSSGSVSRGRVFTHSHTAILTALRELAQRLKLSRDDVIINFVPLHHSMGLMNTVLLPLLVGARVVTMHRDVFASAPSTFLREASKERATCAFVNNGALMHLAKTATLRKRHQVDLTSFRLIVSAGEPITASAFHRFSTAFESAGLRRNVLSSGYGMAEVGGPIAHGAPADPPKLLHLRDTSLPNNLEGPGAAEILSSGSPLPSVQIKIILEDGSIAQDGEIGRILVRSPTATLTVRNKAKVGAMRFGGFIDTGDVGALWKSELFVFGRRDDTVVVSGVNVYPALVESAVKNALPASIEEVLCFGRWDVNEGTSHLVLAIECQTGCLTSHEERRIREHLLKCCGTICRSIYAFKPGAFLRTASGKLARRETIRRLEC